MWMRHLKRVVVAAVLMSSLGGVATAWGWSTNGPLNFTATTGSIKFSDTTTGTSLTCAGTSATNGLAGVLNAKSMDPSGLNLARITFTCGGGASLAGIRVAVTCAAATLNGRLWTSNGGVAPNYFGSLTSADISGFSCMLAIPNCASTVAGTLGSTSYANPTSTAAGRLTISTSGQILTLTNAGGATCTALRLINGDVMLISDASMLNPIYTVTAPALTTSQPRIWTP